MDRRSIIKNAGIAGVLAAGAGQKNLNNVFLKKPICLYLWDWLLIS